MYENNEQRTLYMIVLKWMWPLCIICVVPFFATVELNFTTYTGCQLKTNENYHSIHSFSRWILTWVWICCVVSYAIRKIYIWTISNSRDNNFHHDCYKLYIIISWVEFNIIFKTIFEYIHKKFCFVHTNTFCEYRKNYAHRLACILFLLCWQS